MAKKATVHYICSACGANHSKWGGQCLDCKEWNTIVEFKESAARAGAASAMARGYSGSKEAVSKLSDIKPEDSPRFSTNNVEFDRVLGGGVVPGSVILFYSDFDFYNSCISRPSSCSFKRDSLNFLC